MITHRQINKSENGTVLGGSICFVGGRSSSSSSLSAVTVAEMPMKNEDRLNELESNAVKALLSLGEAFVSQSPYRTPVKKQPEAITCRPLQPMQPQQHHPQGQTARSVIVKAEPVNLSPEEDQQRNHCQISQTTFHQRIVPVSSSISPMTQNGQHHHTQYVREISAPQNGVNMSNQQSTIRLTPSIPVSPQQAPSNQRNSNGSMTSPAVSIQPVVSPVSSSSPMISTIFYQIPATATSTTNGSNGTVVSPSFTIIPAPNGRTVIPLPMVTTSATSLVKIEPSTVVAQTNSATPLNWNNIQLLKVPRNTLENGSGVATFSTLAPALTNAIPSSAAKLLPSPGKAADGKSLVVTATPDGKSPTKSRTRRRSQSTTKGQPRTSRVSSSNSTDFVVCPSVEGLPTIVVDGYEISREIWAKAFLQNDIIHAAGTLFNALFSSEEIKNCTLNGRNGTRQLCPEKRLAIFKIVAWMKNKCQDPYSFNKSPEDSKVLSREEQMMIEKKVFVERRYQTSRKIRDLPSGAAAQQTSPSSSSPNIAPPSVITTVSSTPPTPSKSAAISPGAKYSQKLPCPLPTVPVPAALVQRRDSGSFSTICSGNGDDKGIPKIALIQSSEIIANYFQSADPLPLTASGKPPLITVRTRDGPPPLKMQKVG